MEDWRDVLFRIGWGSTRPHAVDDAALERQRARLARYVALRDLGIELLAAGNLAAAVEYLGAAAIVRRGFPEAHINLARAFEAAGRIEAARQSLEIGLHLAERRGDRQAVRELEGHRATLPTSPPARLDFGEGQTVYSGLTGSRWTVLGRKFGGMGVVYKARDHADGVIHALKTLQAQYLWSDSDRDRFVREAATWVRLDPHRNIVAAEWIEAIEDCPVLVMEWVEGGDLAGLLSSQTLRLERALELAIQFCDGMAFAHRTLEIVHRDIKPANCLLTTQGALKIGDFGLARSFLASRSAAFELSSIGGQARIELTSPYGTWPYMAPEQLDPEASLDGRVDVHAFGVMLYEMLMGELPEENLDRPGQLDLAHMRQKARGRKLPRRLFELILACVAPEPAVRPANFGLIRLELANILTKTSRRPAAPAPEPPQVDARYWNNKAVAFHALGRYTDAISCYDRALEATPADADLWQNKGAAFLCLERHKEAVTYLQRALTLSPDDPEILSNLGHAQAKLRDFDAALGSLTRAAALAPNDPTICRNVAEALCESARPEEALDWIRRGLITDPRNPALLEIEGFSFLMLGRTDDALARFQQGLRIAPRRLGFWKGQAIAYGRHSEHALALDACNTALELHPDEPSILRLKASALTALGDLALTAQASDPQSRVVASDCDAKDLSEFKSDER
jgi:serine/threonine protein kinase